ncbi:hypothetical protein K2Z84_21210, partial [Candidatus Binatia bacterium]|nr:hypothetical protein [Candidatus Binatia bacterium]
MSLASGRATISRRRALRAEPLLHLIAGGALLFAASAALDAWRDRTSSHAGDPLSSTTARGSAPRAPIAIDAAAAS